MIRSQDGRYLFGWSGRPLLSLEEAVRLIRALGVKGTNRQLLAIALRPEIVGGDYWDGGAIGYFEVRCPGPYRAAVVVRGGRFLPATRIWLHQERARVTRSLCMAGPWLWRTGRGSRSPSAPHSRRGHRSSRSTGTRTGLPTGPARSDAEMRAFPGRLAVDGPRAVGRRGREPRAASRVRDVADS